jgi:hypothetical protein
MVRRHLAFVTMAVVAVIAAGCGSGTSDSQASAPASPTDDWGSYPADTSLDERGAVEVYVEALNDRDGEAFCGVVAPWISGRFDIALSDPDAPFSKPLRCPEFVSGFIGYIEDCCPPKFLGAELAEIGELDRRGDLVGVPVTVNLHLEDSDGGRGTYTEPLEDVVWVTKDEDAWRIAKLSRVAAAASLVGGERDVIDQLTAPPDVADERTTYAQEVADAIGRRQGHEGAFGEPTGSVSCPRAKRVEDELTDVVDYRHPAPPTPTPQLPAADIQAVEVEASEGRICVVFEMAGNIQPDTTFEFAIESPDFDWGRAGFTQQFEIELRDDGRARVSSGRDDARRSVSVPADVGREGNRLRVVVDEASFATGRELPGSRVESKPLERFQFRADVTVEQSEERHLHDDLGPGPPEGVKRFPYP